MRVLVVEDDLSTQKAVELVLKREGWAVDLASTGEEAFDFSRAYDYDAMIVDLSLPDTDGIDLIRKLRLMRIQTPVIILSGYGESEKKVRGLDVGADDYVTKPYDRSELVARLQAVVRRSMGHARSVVQIGRLEIDLASHTAQVGGELVPLTAKEYAILELLALRKGATLTKEQFLNHLYGGMDEPDLKIIDVFVCKLRKKLAAFLDGETCIETVWGRGYMIRDPERTSPLPQREKASTPSPLELAPVNG